MRRYGNNMKCAFISVLMNLINGERPLHNFLPSTSLSKKVTHFLIMTMTLFILRSPELSASSVSQWNAIKYYMEMVFYMNDLGIRKIFLLSRTVVTSTHFTANSWLHCYLWNTWLWWFRLGFSIHGASRFPPVTVIPVGWRGMHDGLGQKLDFPH